MERTGPDDAAMETLPCAAAAARIGLAAVLVGDDWGRAKCAKIRQATLWQMGPQASLTEDGTRTRALQLPGTK